MLECDLPVEGKLLAGEEQVAAAQFAQARFTQEMAAQLIAPRTGGTTAGRCGMVGRGEIIFAWMGGFGRKIGAPGFVGRNLPIIFSH